MWAEFVWTSNSAAFGTKLSEQGHYYFLQYSPSSAAGNWGVAVITSIFKDHLQTLPLFSSYSSSLPRNEEACGEDWEQAKLPGVGDSFFFFSLATPHVGS